MLYVIIVTHTIYDNEQCNKHNCHDCHDCYGEDGKVVSYTGREAAFCLDYQILECSKDWETCGCAACIHRTIPMLEEGHRENEKKRGQ